MSSKVKVPSLPSALIWHETDDGIVVVDPTEGKVRVLNGVASSIWKLVSKQMDVNDIQEQIVSEYDVSAEQAQTDVSEFLTQLAGQGLVAFE